MLYEAQPGSQTNEKVNIMLLVTECNLQLKGLTSHFFPNTFIADSGATCHIPGSIEGIKDGYSAVLSFQDVLYIPKLMVDVLSLAKVISTKGVQLSS
jgi:hypothetical protein